jgi:hypothetical protein
MMQRVYKQQLVEAYATRLFSMQTLFGFALAVQVELN